MTSPKIFCIGLNKTGTISLHTALTRLGYRSLHHAPPVSELGSLQAHIDAAREIAEGMRARKKAGEPMLAGLEDYDAFSDIGTVMHSFPFLDRQYPGSKFIYTARDTESWLDSREKHVRRNLAARAKGAYVSGFDTIDREDWRATKERHEKRVREYFAERPNDLLILSITEGEGYEKLCPFLGHEPLDEPFPQRNRARAPQPERDTQ